MKIKYQSSFTKNSESYAPLPHDEDEKIDQILKTLANIIVERLLEQKQKKAY